MSIMTNIYFVRHAESDNKVHDDMSRPLTEKGTKDRTLVTNYLGDKGISAVFSSPYKRAYDTVEDFVQQNGLDITCIDDFRERKVATHGLRISLPILKCSGRILAIKFCPGKALVKCRQEILKLCMSCWHLVMIKILL